MSSFGFFSISNDSCSSASGCPRSDYDRLESAGLYYNLLELTKLCSPFVDDKRGLRRSKTHLDSSSTRIEILRGSELCLDSQLSRR